jgi:hypothetical protein
MKNKRLVVYPALLIVSISVILILYSLFLSPANDQFQRSEDAGGTYKTLGNIAIIFAAISFTWLRLKKKRISTSKPIKWLAKFMYSIHTYMGWAALALIAVHGTYFILTDFQKSATKSGLAAFLLLLTLAGYGYMFRKVKKPIMRKIHFALALSWIVAALIHAGGIIILMSILTLIAWLIIGWVEKATLQKV